jgi:hypothetical protein
MDRNPFEEMLQEGYGTQTPAPSGNPAPETQQKDEAGANPFAQMLQEAEAGASSATVEVEDEGGFLSSVGDVVKSIPGGVADSIENTGDMVSSAAEWAGLPLGVKIGGDGVSLVWDSEEMDDVAFGKHGVSDNITPRSNTMAGKATRGVSQFITSFIGVGKLLKPFQAASRTGKTTKAMVQGALADFAGFNPHEDRLSDFVNNQVPVLANPVTEYLAADPNDSEAEGRFKNAIEGLLLGGVTDAFFETVRGLKRARAAKSQDEALRIIAETADVVDVAGAPRAADDAAEAGVADLPDQGDLFTVKGSEAPSAGVESAARGEGAKAAATLPNTRGSGQLFHGTSRPLDRLGDDTEHFTSANIYGQGFYTTDALDVAQGYSRKGGGTEQTLYRVEPRGDVPLYDMEAPLQSDMQQRLLQTEDNYLLEMALEQEPGNLRELFDEIRDISSIEGYSADDVQNVFDVIRADLEAQGYRGLSHIGGLKTGTDRHQVRIYWRPNEDVGIQTLDDPYAVKGVDAPAEAAGDAAPQTREAPTEPPAEAAGEVTLKNREAQGVEPRDFGLVDADALSQKLELRRDPDGISMEPKSDWFNWDKMDGPQGAKEVIELTANAMQGRLDELIQKGTYSFQQMTVDAGRELADTVDMGFDRLVANTAKLAENQKAMASNFLAGKMALQSIGRKIYELAEKIDGGLGTEQDMLQYASLVQKQGELVANIKAIQTTSARVTASGRIRTRDALTNEQLTAAGVADELARAGDPDAIKRHARNMRLLGKDNLKGQIKYAQSTGFERMLEINAELFINSILSGPKTHLLNMTSNAIQTVLLPAEKMVGGLVGMDRTMFMEGVRQYGYMRQALGDSIKMMAKAGWDEANVLDPGISTVDAPRYAIHSDMDNPLGSIIRTLGKGVRLPSRFLGAEDELFKQINYRSALKAHLHTQALQKFPKDAAKRAEWIQQEFAKGFDFQGRGINEEALAFTREATFTTALKDTPTQSGKDSVGRSIERFVNDHPSTRIIMPFVRTPTNILRQAWARTPGLNMLQAEFRRDILSGDPRRAARARGKLATGAALWSYGAMLAAEGRITGGGPADYKEKQRLMETGWRPYSFVTTGANGKKVYTSFQRLDPYATFFQIAADVTHVMSNLNEAEREGLGVAVVTALSRSLQEKSYLTGLSNLLSAFEQPERKAERYFQDLVSAYVPTGLKQSSEFVGLTDDPYMREANSVVQAMMKKIPGLSDELPPKRSWVTGEPVKYPGGFLFPDSVSPFAQGQSEDDVVLTELAELQHGFTAPSGKFGGIDLREERPEVYDRYLQLHSSVKLRGQTLYKALEDHFTGRRYNREAEQALLDDGASPLTARIITAYRRKAKAELVKEFPELRDAEVQKAKDRAGAFRGNEDAIDRLRGFVE